MHSCASVEKRGRWLWILAVGIGAGWSEFPRAYAVELSYGVGYLGEYSDNVGLVQTNPQHDWVNMGVAGISIQAMGAGLAARLQTQAAYRDYQNDSFEDGPLYYLNGVAVWHALPRYLTWTVLDIYDQVARDVARPDDLASNLVNTNVFQTGPDVFIHMGPVNTLVLGARLTNMVTQEHVNDNSRYGANVRWDYMSNSEISYSANYQYENVTYDDEVLNDNYVRQSAFFRIARQREFSNLMFDLGATRVDPERGESERGPLIRLIWDTRLSSESTFKAVIGRDFLDFGQSLVSNVADPSGTEADLPVAPLFRDNIGDLYQARYAEAIYQALSGNYHTILRGYYRDYDYLTIADDRSTYRARFQLTHNPGGLISTMAYIFHMSTTYDDDIREMTETGGGLRVQYRLTRNLSTSLEYRRRRHSSTIVSDEFKENRTVLGIIYASDTRLSPILVERVVP